MYEFATFFTDHSTAFEKFLLRQRIFQYSAMGNGFRAFRTHHDAMSTLQLRTDSPKEIIRKSKLSADKMSAVNGIVKGLLNDIKEQQIIITDGLLKTMENAQWAKISKNI